MIGVHVLNKRPVNFEFDGGNVLQLLHHRVAGAEVIDGELEIAHAQAREDVEGKRKFHQARLRNFKNDTLCREVILARKVHKDIGELEIAQGTNGNIDGEAGQTAVRVRKLLYLLKRALGCDPAEPGPEIQGFYSGDEVIRVH